MPITLAAGG